MGLGEPYVMAANAAPVVELGRGPRALIGIFAAVTLLGAGMVVAKAVESPSTIPRDVLPGGSLWMSLSLLLISFAGGLGSSIRLILGLDALVRRDPITGAPEFSLRRAAGTLPMFWLCAVSSLLTVWGYAGFVLVGIAIGPSGSWAVVGCGAAMLLGSTVSAMWMGRIALGLKHRSQ